MKNDSKLFFPQVLASQFVGTEFLNETTQEGGQEPKDQGNRVL